MNNEHLLYFVQLNQNVDYIADTSQYLKFIKKYTLKLLDIHVYTIYENLKYYSPIILSSKYTNRDGRLYIENSNTYSRSVVDTLTYINLIYNQTLNTKIPNAGFASFVDCELANFTPINVMCGIKYIDLHTLQLSSVLSLIQYPMSVLVLKRSTECLLIVPSINSMTPPLALLNSDLILMPYNSNFIYNISFMYKVISIGLTALNFLVRIYSALTGTDSLSFESYLEIPVNSEYTSYSGTFTPSPLADDPDKTKIRISFYLNRMSKLNNNILLYLSIPRIWWSNK